MTAPFNYKGVLPLYMKAIIRMKEACGQTNLSTKWTYKEFDEFTIQYGLTEPITPKNLRMRGQRQDSMIAAGRSMENAHG